jgi:hypothetical protein
MLMKKVLLFIFLVVIACSSFAQSDSVLNLIFVPHPRSESKLPETVLPAIEKIDFSRYDMVLLGGDLTWSVSTSRTWMDYCDGLFNLGSPNTLWTMGNHDINNRPLIKEYTGREAYYSYYRDSITFVVLDTERASSGFTSTYIINSQLTMLRNVCDTISDSRYLVVLHSRLIWMIGNKDFSTRLDSVAESTKQLDTTNFYQDVFPLLQKVKAKGIKVLCLGGDKSKINIDYSPEDSITFLTSTMAPEFADSVNDVMIFNYKKADNTMSWKFVRLDKVEKKTQNPLMLKQIQSNGISLRIWPTQGSGQMNIFAESAGDQMAMINIYTMQGKKIRSIRVKTNEIESISISTPGIYIVNASISDDMITRKIVIQ